MKLQFFFILILGVFTLFTSCDTAKSSISMANLPGPVSAAFTATHPGLKTTWELESDGNYEAEFKLAGEEVSETYSATGQLLETEVEIKKSVLPAAVLAAIATNFPGHELEEAARLTYPDGRIAYEAELEGDNEVKFDAVFSATGELIGKIISPEREKD